MSVKEDVRAYLRANLFDGNEDGRVTMRVKSLLDEVEDAVEHALNARMAEAERRLRRKGVVR